MKLVLENNRYVFLCQINDRWPARDAGFQWNAKEAPGVWSTDSARKALKCAAYANEELRARILATAQLEPDPDRISLTFDGSVYRFHSPFQFKDLAKNAGMQYAKHPRPHWWTADTETAIRCFNNCAQYDELFDCAQGLKAQLESHLEVRNAALDASRALDAEIDVPCPLGLNYYPFQLAAIDYALKRKNTLLGDQMGLGKTIETIGFYNSIGAKTMLIVCPASLKLNWQREVEKWAVRKPIVAIADSKFWPKGADVIIINYESLGRTSIEGTKVLRREIRDVEWDLLVVDECFPYSTPVLTSIGYRPIGEIVENALNIYVASCDLSTNRLEWQPIQRWVRKSKPKQMVKITHQRGALLCTENHKIWTEEDGYVQAIHLSNKHHLRLVRENSTSSQARTIDSQVLFETMLGKNERSAPRSPRENQTGSVQAVDRQSVRRVRQQIRVAFVRKGQQAAAILRQFLRGTMAGTTALPSGRACQGRSKATGEKNRPKPRVGQSHEREQPNARSGNQRESAAEDGRTNIPEPGRQRATYRASEATSSGIGSADGIRDLDFIREEPISVFTKPLQSGHSRSRREGGDRSGRPESQHPKVAFSRQAQDGCFERSRVVSIEIQEQRGIGEHESVCPDGPFVYNLDIAFNHNYVASDVLASNCHRLKNKKTQRAKFTFAIKAARTLALTGTPIPNRPIEAQPILAHLCPDVEQFDYWPFAKRFASMHKGPFGFDVSGASNLAELQSLARVNCMIRRLKSEVLRELPPKRRQIIELPASGHKALINAEVSALTQSEALREELRTRVELAKASDDPVEYDEAVDALKKGTRALFEEMSRLRHETALAKLPLVVEHVTDMLEEQPKVIIFGWHKDVLDELHSIFRDSVLVHGDIPLLQRQAAVDRFQNDSECRVFIGGINAAGVGLTLTAAPVVIFCELDWVPANITQAEDRAHRIGQEADSVLIQHLVLEGSLDAQMARTLVAKQEIADKALDRQGGIDMALDDVDTEFPEENLVLPEKIDGTDESVQYSRPATYNVKREQIAKEAETITPEQIELVHQGLKILSGMCDGAVARDGTGFNGMDSRIGKSLASHASLSPKAAALGKRILKKYSQTQLKGMVDSLWQ